MKSLIRSRSASLLAFPTQPRHPRLLPPAPPRALRPGISSRRHAPLSSEASLCRRFPGLPDPAPTSPSPSSHTAARSPVRLLLPPICSPLLAWYNSLHPQPHHAFSPAPYYQYQGTFHGEKVTVHSDLLSIPISLITTIYVCFR